MEALIRAFLEARSAEGCTPKTILWHRNALKRFSTWGNSELPDDVEKWTAQHLRSYIVSLQDSRLKASSIATYVRSLRAFITWLFDEEVITKNIAVRVKEPRVPNEQRKPFEAGELNAMLAACESLRDRAILSVLLDCGLRAHELCNLKRSDVMTEQRVLVVMGKGQKQRVVPYSTKTGVLLRKHLLKHTNDVVFPSLTGSALTPSGLLQLIARIGDRAKVDNAHPHRFRHSMAVFYLRYGGDPLSLQRILGHTTLTMTNRYVGMVTTDLQRIHDTASPLTHLSKGGKQR